MHDFSNSVTDAQRQLNEEAAMPSRLSQIVSRWCALAVIGGVIVWVFFGFVARAAEIPRPWQVWNETANAPWLSKKGEPATATGATACSLALHEVSKAVPSGTRLSCRDTSKRKEQ